MFSLMNRLFNIKTRPVYIATALALMVFTSAEAQRLYKWVDADGNVYYSDQVPPDQNDYARKQLNSQGVVIDRVDRAKTAAEKAEERRAREALEIMFREAARKRKEDAKLLSTYASANDILRSQKQQIDGIERSIQASQAFISTQARNLSNLMERASQAQSQGRDVSPALQSLIDDVQRQISDQQSLIEERKSEKNQSREFYKNELNRYEALTGKKADSQS